MNGGMAASVNNNKTRATGSRKRKRGLPPRKAEVPQVEVEVVQADQSSAVSETIVPTPYQNDAAGAQSAALSSCSICGKVQTHITVDLSANTVMRNTLSSYCQLPAENLSHALKSVCVQCVYKVNAHKDVTRSLTMRLERLTKVNAPLQKPVAENKPKVREKPQPEEPPNPIIEQKQTSPDSTPHLQQAQDI